MKSPCEVAEQVMGLYRRFGKADYIGEPVSQIEHMTQAAKLAESGGFDEEVILAAFLHDIGHLVALEQPSESMGGYGAVSHEKIGSDYLRALGFSTKVAELVRSHVQAKRYLTYKYPDYYKQLSEASRKTLEQQGGIMTAEEALAFETDPLMELKIQMRRWDEQAKEINLPVPLLDRYKVMIEHHLNLQRLAT